MALNISVKKHRLAAAMQDMLKVVNGEAAQHDRDEYLYLTTLVGYGVRVMSLYKTDNMIRLTLGVNQFKNNTTSLYWEQKDGNDDQNIVVTSYGFASPPIADDLAKIIVKKAWEDIQADLILPIEQIKDFKVGHIDRKAPRNVSSFTYSNGNQFATSGEHHLAKATVTCMKYVYEQLWEFRVNFYNQKLDKRFSVDLIVGTIYGDSDKKLKTSIRKIEFTSDFYFQKEDGSFMFHNSFNKYDEEYILGYMTRKKVMNKIYKNIEKCAWKRESKFFGNKGADLSDCVLIEDSKGADYWLQSPVKVAELKSEVFRNTHTEIEVYRVMCDGVALHAVVRKAVEPNQNITNVFIVEQLNELGTDFCANPYLKQEIIRQVDKHDFPQCFTSEPSK